MKMRFNGIKAYSDCDCVHVRFNVNLIIIFFFLFIIKIEKLESKVFEEFLTGLEN